MNIIKITPPSNNLYTLVPNWFIDHFLASSNGDFVKVYLLLLRSLTNHETQFSTSNFADRLQLTESDIVRALKFWSSQSLLELTQEDKQVTGIAFVDPETSRAFEEEIVTTLEETLPEQKSEVPLIHITPSAKPQYTMDELSNFMSANTYRDLIYVTGRYLGKNLNQNDLGTLISFNDWLGLPVEVIEWLIEYCASNDHRNMRYIEKVAIEWADQNIDTLEKAKAYTDTYNKKYYGIKKALGLSGRNPVA
ncbi:MAG: DnaD domain protein, partial [Vallitaleaceae bacterium]|nr:DnaD domain protein [Vallitaleaceae bacterium]